MGAMPIRVEADLYDAAKVAGGTLSRSTAQQLSHWARIGRELESARGISSSDIADVLAGRRSYDDLGTREQAVVRAEWDERIAAARTGLNLETGFLDAGESWVEVAPDGTTVTKGLAPGDTTQVKAAGMGLTARNRAKDPASQTGDRTPAVAATRAAPRRSR